MVGTFGPQYNQAKVDGKTDVFIRLACLSLRRFRPHIVPLDLEDDPEHVWVKLGEVCLLLSCSATVLLNITRLGPQGEDGVDNYGQHFHSSPFMGNRDAHFCRV